MADTWPVVEANDFMRLTIEGTLCGQQLRTTFAYNLKTVTGTPDPTDQVVGAFLADTQWQDIQGNFIEVVPSNYTLDAIAWQWFSGTTVYVKQRQAVGVAGNDVSATTANVQASITRRPIIADRLGVGGIRVPIAPVADNVVNGELLQVFKDKLQLLADAMKQNIVCTVGGGSTNTFEPIVLHKEGPTYTKSVVFDCEVMPTSRVLRRRTARLGI